MLFSNINYYLRKSAYVFIEIPIFLDQLASLLYERADVPVFYSRHAGQCSHLHI